MDELGLVHAGLSAVDDIIAKAIGLSEVAQMGRIEVRQRQLLTVQWDKLASKAEKNAIGVLTGGSGAVRDGEIGRMLGAIDKQMGQWAFKVQDSFNDDMERVYNLAREAGFKKATKQTTASLQYDTKPFTAEVKKATPIAAEILPSFDIIDESAVAALKRNNTFWIGAHYNQNVRQGISEATSDVIIKQGRRRADSIAVLKAKLGPELKRIRIPSGWVGNNKQYFEALTANAATVGRVQGQLVSFTQAGVTRYVIVNPTDERTCPVCGHMDGKVFSVQWATTHMENVLQASNPDEVRGAHPWLSAKQMREISPTSGKSTVADSRKLTQAGFGQPPFHFRCRCTVDVSEEAGSFEPLVGDELKPVKLPPLKVPKRPKATGPGRPPKQPKVPPKPKPPPIPAPFKRHKDIPGTFEPDKLGKALGKASVFAQRDVREQLDALLADFRMVSYDRRSTLPGRALFARSDSSIQSFAAGQHSWDGTIALAPGISDDAERFLKSIAAGRKPDRKSISGMRVLIHEAVHGHSPMLSSVYEKAGAVIEEVTTEMAARGILKRKWGQAVTRGSYARPINNVRAEFGDAVRDIVGRANFKELNEAFVEASIALHSVDIKALRTSSSYVKLFAEKFADNTPKRLLIGKSKKEIANIKQKIVARLEIRLARLKL